MAEETEDSPSTFGDLKKTIVGILATILTAGGGIVVTQFENLFGGGDESTEVAAPSQSQNVSVSGPEIIINIPEQKQSVVREVVREVPVETKKDTVVAEPPQESAQSRLLKYKKN
jgi:hypothetical protein